MGQQQLLLLVLGIVIVGLAVVVGIQAFSENQKKSNEDAIVNDGMRIASDIQSWALKPTTFDGGNGDFHVGDATTGALVSFADFGYEEDSGFYNNANGTFALTAVGDGIEILGYNYSTEVAMAVVVCGMETGDISTVNPGYPPLNGSSSCP
ncbi:MAG: hypothetical protein AAF791_15860 [Bacteroidota bacterium]